MRSSLNGALLCVSVLFCLLAYSLSAHASAQSGAYQCDATGGTWSEAAQKCHCPESQSLTDVGGRCGKIICPPGERLQGGQCRPDRMAAFCERFGRVFTNGRCQRPSAAHCADLPGRTMFRGRCVSTGEASCRSAARGNIWVGNRCYNRRLPAGGRG